jgi:multidrug resistance efflux pump
VRIELKNADPAQYPLHGGLSATVNVDTQYERHLFGANTWPKQVPPAAATAPAASGSELTAAE